MKIDRPRPVTLELLHPDVKASVNAHREAYDAMRDIMERADADVQSILERHGRVEWGRIISEKNAALNELNARFMLNPEDYVMLLGAAGDWKYGVPTLDPNPQLA